VKWENGEKEREGEERKAGRSSLAGQTRESLPRRLREKGRKCHSPVNLGSC